LFLRVCVENVECSPDSAASTDLCLCSEHVFARFDVADQSTLSIVRRLFWLPCKSAELGSITGIIISTPFSQAQQQRFADRSRQHSNEFPRSHRFTRPGAHARPHARGTCLSQ
jgi:hypothetical protein